MRFTMLRGYSDAQIEQELWDRGYEYRTAAAKAYELGHYHSVDALNAQADAMDRAASVMRDPSLRISD